MNNLKRVLSLGMAGTMLAGMMTAGAADFTDAEEINNTDAVNTMVALNIINGKDDGSFGPTETVTRAQMAKMITLALNGGKDPVLGTKVNPTYSDIKGHWAEKYIEYCSSLGIISGQGDGTFAPDAPVTGSAAAKMMLIAMGYDAKNSELTGLNWEINTNVIAGQKNLYADLALNPSAPLSRDNAAQLIWNAMDAKMVKYSYQLTTVNGELQTVAVAEDKGESLLESKFDLVSKYGYMTSTTYNSTKEEYKYTFGDDDFGDQITGSDALADSATFTAEEDFSDLYGQKVKVLYKDNSSKTVYGMYAAGDVIFTGVYGDITEVDTDNDRTNDAYKLDGTTYDYSSNAAYKFNASTATPSAYDTVTAIDNDGDGKIDALIYNPVEIEEVTYVGSKYIIASTKYEFEKYNIADGLKDGDYVVIADDIVDTKVITKLDTKTGTVTATKSGKAKIDGEWYNVNGQSVDLKSEYEFVAYNGYLFSVEEISETAKVENAVYVLEKDDVGIGTKAGTQTAKLLFADGTKKVITVDKIDAKTKGTMADIAADNDVQLKTMYTYKVDSDGNYELTQIVAGDFDDTADLKDYSIKDGKATKTSSTTYRFADDAVIFVVGDDDTKAVTGATVNAWGTTAVTKTSNVYSNKANGFAYVALGLLDVTGADIPNAAGDTAYGWLVADGELVSNDDDEKVVEMQIWNGTEVITVLSDETSESSWTAGMPISYTDLGDGTIEDVTDLSSKADV